MYLFDRYKAIRTAKKILNEELELGVPKKATRKNGKRKEFFKPYYCGRFSSITLKACDERPFTFRVEYTKKHSLEFTITPENLDLSYSPNGMKMIREQYKHYEFTFYKMSTTIKVGNYFLNNANEFIAKLREEVQYWNRSGLYNLLLELYKV